MTGLRVGGQLPQLAECDVTGLGVPLGPETGRPPHSIEWHWMVAGLEAATGIDEKWLVREIITSNGLAPQKSNEAGDDGPQKTRSDLLFHRTHTLMMVAFFEL
jgi:hypothetical protein